MSRPFKVSLPPLLLLSACLGSGCNSEDSSQAKATTTDDASSLPSDAQDSTSTTTDASDNPTGPNSSPLKRLDQFIDRYVNGYLIDDEFARMRGDVALSHRGSIVSKHSYQEAADQRYSFGSITKTITAVAILQLEQAGKLHRDDLLRTHIPELPESHAAITLEQLLAHRSGLGDFLEDEGMLELLPDGQTREQMITRIANKAPEFSAGTATRYSNSGYYLLGIVLERASKLTLAKYFKKYIFAPAQMQHSDLSDNNIAVGHMPRDGKVTEALRSHPSISFSAGGVYGTSEDLLSFGKALMDGTLLPKDVVDQMIEPQGSVGNAKYGLGIFTLPLQDGQDVIGHNGSNFGHRASWYITKDGKWSSAILSNMATVETDEIALDALKMAITGKYIEPRDAVKTLPFDPAVAKAMAGSYQLDPAQLPELEKQMPASTLEELKSLVWRGEKQHLIKLIGQPQFQVQQTAQDEFISRETLITITVQRKDGVVSGLTLMSDPLVLRYLREG